MTLTDLTATALPDGNQIAITWRAAGPDQVQVVRRLAAYPETPDPAAGSQGEVIVDSDRDTIDVLPDGRRRVLDTSLAAERTYYYQVFPYRTVNGKRVYDQDSANRVSATATGRYEFAELMYQLLPGIYRRFDTAGQLRGLLEIVGGQLDQLYSAVRAVPGLIDVNTVDGRLLPLLAHWIGWRLDNSLGLDRQRRELRGAVRLYQATQTMDGLGAAVLRVSGWRSTGKEYVQNVAMTNRPERLLLWLNPVDGAADPVPVAAPLSFDEAAGGRIAVAEADGRTRLYYATSRLGQDEIWTKEHTEDGWQPSSPVVARPGVDREPAVARWGEAEWLFWASLRTGTGWRIDYRRRTARRGWSPISTFGTDAVQRRSPAVLVDDAGALWVFWREQIGGRWTVRYQRFTDSAAQTLSPTEARTFPPDGETDPRVESDLSVRFCPGTGPRIWVLWARREALGPQDPGQRRWRVVSRFKQGTDATVSDWTSIVPLPGVPAAPGHHDREPAAQVAPNGALTAYLSSTRDGSWSIWQVSMNSATHTWGDPRAVTAPPHSDRAPVAFPLDEGRTSRLVVVYRSGRPVRRGGQRFLGTVTSDQRYCGSTTVRTGNHAQLEQRGRRDDVATYLYDAGPPGGRTDADLIARDTVGLYLDAAGAEPDAIADGRRRLNAVLPEFLPATARVVLIEDVTR